MVRVFDLNTEEEMLTTINLNVLSTTMMTRMVLPGMKQRGRGIIVNMSSTSCYRPAAYLNLYASTKAFVTSFSLGLQHELQGSGVECQVVTPGMVQTNMITKFDGEIPWYISVTTPESLAQFGVFTLGKTSHTCGGWMHAFQVIECGVFLCKSLLIESRYIFRFAGRIWFHFLWELSSFLV